jgi:hypothetical protein
MNSYAAPGTRRSLAAEAILRREEAGGKKRCIGPGQGAARACPAEGKGAVLIGAILPTRPAARRGVAEASGKRLLGNNKCDKRLREANLIIARPRITPELSRPAREVRRSLEATKRVRLE